MVKITRSAWASSILATIIAVLMLVFVITTSRAVINLLDEINDQRIPQAKAVARIQSLLIQHERVLYSCYINQDITGIGENMAALQKEIHTSIDFLATDGMLANYAQSIRKNFRPIEQTAYQLEAAMQSEPINEELAMDLLGNITNLSAVAEDDLISTAQMLDQVSHDGMDSNRDMVSRLSVVMSSFSVSMGVLFVLFILFLIRYNQESKKRKQLNQFPELNPNPVLSFDLNFNLNYCNPATLKTLKKHIGEDAQDEQILPKDYKHRLEQMEKLDLARQTWTFEIGDLIFLYRVHFAKAQKMIQIYIENVTEQFNQQKKLEYIAYHDEITDLPNRNYLMVELNRSVKNNETKFLLVMYVIGLAKVVSHAGNEAANDVVKQIKQRFLLAGFNLIKLETNLYALNLDEFNKEQQQLLYEIFNHAFCFESQSFDLKVEVGIASSEQAQSGFQLINNASRALHTLEKKNDQWFALYDQTLGEKILEKNEREQDLKKAIEANELVLHYQPQQCLKDSTFSGCEALVRWQRKDKLLSPFFFIPLAEEIGFITKIGDWVLETAIKQVADWQSQGKFLNDVMAINVSAQQFVKPNFVDQVKMLLRDFDVEAKNIELEITETVFMDDIEYCIKVMNDLKALGVLLAIDDFGTGYSSFSYLTRFPVDKLKIDKAFVDDVDKEQGQTIVKAMIELGHHLNMDVLCEGVEHKNQSQIITSLGCDQIQGYFFAKPITHQQLFERFF